MRISVIFYLFIAFSNAAAAQSYSLRVTNFKLAQQGFYTSDTRYLQSGSVLTPENINYSLPFCQTRGFRFNLDPSKVYVVSKIEPKRPGVGSDPWALNIELEPKSLDPMASFQISCIGPSKVIIDDVKNALLGIYELTEK
jgi:hypothetical protein